jgi:hypothetical protein
VLCCYCINEATKDLLKLVYIHSLFSVLYA